MIEILTSLKNDLLGRRLLPLLALAGVALVGAIGYAVLGGGGGSGSQASVASIAGSLPPVPPTLANPAPANPNLAVSETTSGARYQRAGATRDPFIPLPSPKTTTAAAKVAAGSTSSSSSSSSGSKSSGGSSSGGGTAPSGSTTPTPPPAKPKQPQTVYQVAALFGPLPAAGENPKLTPYADLTRLTPLPSAKNALLVFTGVGPAGKGAIFTLLQAAILKGSAACLPSASQCEAIDVPAGGTEELDYLTPEGKTANYELQVVTISKRDASTIASVRRAARVSKAGRALLRGARLGVTDRLRYSAVRDVVVFTK
jgi:hypothetical protein